MTMERAEWRIGTTIHGQPVKLVWERDYMKRPSFKIVQEALNQRDETMIVGGLTADVLVEAAAVAKAWRP